MASLDYTRSSITKDSQENPDVSSLIATPMTQLSIDDNAGTDNDETIYFNGAQFYLLYAAIFLALALVSIEVPIVTTSVATITDDLGQFDKATWITSAYLLGFVGVLIVWSKLSDIFGRKYLLLVSLGLFGVFSGACGAAQTLTQLIIFRAFQGAGGGATYTLCNIIGYELVPDSQIPVATGIIAAIFGVTLATGPIVGGAISRSTHWRWIFLLNCPAVVPAILILLYYLPSSFPNHGKPGHQGKNITGLFTTKNLARVDLIGVAMIWLGILALASGLEEAGISHGWSSAFVISMLVVGGILILGFFGWERYISMKAGVMEPVFPWHFATNRVVAGLLLCALSQGMPWIGALFQLPQKFQIVNGESPLAAGIKTIPFSASAPVGSVLTAVMAKKGLPPIYIVLVASLLQIVGFVLLGTLPLSSHISKAQYGYQVIAGFSTGTNSSILVMMAPFFVKHRKEKSTIVGAFNQFRFTGGALGLAIISTAMSGYVKPRLSEILSKAQVDSILKSASALAELKGEQRERAIEIMADGYNLEFKILAGLAALQVIGTAMMWQKPQLKTT